jgi:hypothetical protein
LSKIQVAVVPASSKSSKSSNASSSASFSDASAQPAAGAALPKIQDKIPAAPESKLDDSKIQIQPTFIQSVPVVPDSKRMSFVAKRRMAAEAVFAEYDAAVAARDALAATASSSKSSPVVAESFIHPFSESATATKDLFSSSPTPSSLFSPSSSTFAAKLSEGETKAAFSVGIKRDAGPATSQRAAKRQRQKANQQSRATAADFF